MKHQPEMTLTDLRSASRQWQKKLRLGGWDITTRWSKPKELDEAYGECRRNVNHRQAEIVILPPGERKTSERPVLHTLVHELLHVLLASFIPYGSGDFGRVYEEQTVNALTEALTGIRSADYDH